MMSRVDFENKIMNQGLAKKAPHFDLGMTAKIPKEVENFKPDIPTGHRGSNARPDLSSLSFHRNSRVFNDLPKTPVHHTSAQIHMPNFYYTNLNAEKEKRHTPIETNFLNRMYGIPPDREMKFDNPAAVIMGADKMSEQDFAIKTWQAQEKGFMSLYEEQEANRASGTTEETPEETKTNDVTSTPLESIPEESGQIEVKPAFESNLPPPPPEKGEEKKETKKRVRPKMTQEMKEKLPPKEREEVEKTQKRAKVMRKKEEMRKIIEEKFAEGAFEVGTKAEVTVKPKKTPKRTPGLTSLNISEYSSPQQHTTEMSFEPKH